ISWHCAVAAVLLRAKAIEHLEYFPALRPHGAGTGRIASDGRHSIDVSVKEHLTVRSRAAGRAEAGRGRFLPICATGGEAVQQSRIALSARLNEAQQGIPIERQCAPRAAAVGA